MLSLSDFGVSFSCLFLVYARLLADQGMNQTNGDRTKGAIALTNHAKETAEWLKQQ